MSMKKTRAGTMNTTMCIDVATAVTVIFAHIFLNYVMYFTWTLLHNTAKNTLNICSPIYTELFIIFILIFFT